jgi:hypothetical protein
MTLRRVTLCESPVSLTGYEHRGNLEMLPATANRQRTRRRFNGPNGRPARDGRRRSVQTRFLRQKQKASLKERGKEAERDLDGDRLRQKRVR